MKPFLLLLLTLFILSITEAQSFTVTVDSVMPAGKRFAAADARVQYMGRVDLRNTSRPRIWAPGACITIRFEGKEAGCILYDQELWGKNHNYLEIVVDGEARRIQTKYKKNGVRVSGLKNGTHILTICKNTEANIGYIEPEAFTCAKLLAPPARPLRKIECIGNSITCGTGSDQSVIPCGKGVWHDQHNAYMAYGPLMARAMKAEWQLSSVSGIGLVHSCCNMDIVMPPVFDKTDMRGDSVLWDFGRYQPDVVTVCLGQNDGIQDSAYFCGAYVRFLQQVRNAYPRASIVLISSPMADAALRNTMRKQLPAVVKARQQSGDRNVYVYLFERSYTAGCDYHPSLEEHNEIARLLTAFIRKLKHWR